MSSNPKSDQKESGKYNAAKLALKLIKDGMLLGIGSGSTVEIFLRLLGERIKSEGITVYGVPSSYRSHFLATEAGIKITDFFENAELDLCIDGADQVDSRLNCIKGGGGALTREKIIASASRKVVIIVDESKISKVLSLPVPIEVLPFACGYVIRHLQTRETVRALKIRIREGSGKLGPVITDNGNFLLDCDFGIIERPEELEIKLNSIPGVVENGIFSHTLIDTVIVGNRSSARYL
jgi:ribose 5-phosphate isomerase A